jgi:hypothetical protein
MTENRKVLFFAPYGEFLVHKQVDAILATALRIRGSEVAVVTCGQSFNYCPVFGTRDGDPKAICQNCDRCGQSFFKAFDFNNFVLKNYISEQIKLDCESWLATLDPANYETAKFGSLPMGEWAIFGLYNKFRTLGPKLHSAEARGVFKELLRNVFHTYFAVKAILEQFNPDFFVTFHGNFPEYKAAVEAAHRRDIRYICHEKGFSNNSFRIVENGNIHCKREFLRTVNVWQKCPVSKEDFKSAIAVRDAWEGGTNVSWQSFNTTDNNRAGILQKLNIPLGSAITTVFTSSEFELMSYYDYEATQHDLIMQLIKLYQNRSDYLVIRHHPNLYGKGGVRQFADHAFISQILEQTKKAGANVRIVPPTETIDSYALMYASDACIAPYSSTVLEAALRGVAGATNPNSLYRKAAVGEVSSYDPVKLGMLIDGLIARTHSDDIEYFREAIRFMNAYSNKLSIQFKSFGIKASCQPDIRVTKAEELLPGVDPALDRVLDHIVYGSPPNIIPTRHDLRASVEVETDMCRTELGLIKRNRQAFQEAIANCLASAAPLGTILIGLKNDDFNGIQPIARRQGNRLTIVQSESILNSVDNLVEALSGHDQAFVQFASPRIILDEGVLLSAEASLAKEPETKLAVAHGLYTLDDSGIISGEIFTNRGRAIPSSFFKHSAQDILGCFYFKRAQLLNFIRSGNFNSLNQLVLAIMESEAVIRSEIPMGHIHLFN